MQCRRSQAKGAAFFFTVIANNRKSILCHEAHVAPIVRLSAHDEVSCGRPMPAPYLIRGLGTSSWVSLAWAFDRSSRRGLRRTLSRTMNRPRYRYWLVLIRHVARQHPLRICAFVLYPDHTCLRSARRQVYGICTFDVNVGHEW